ncbi:hypothetical protein Sango_2290600 [Sesamum angolense]|uniref:Uncharacterized protein n=1 Tax=Sesamum angolense TaxID=2727404 RepID=A0AAE1WAH5_9LAMI|nr:hypothetical protein Sango_2290600 [Sesamum angolense]
METTDEDSEAETDDDYFEGSSGNGEAAADNSVNVNDVGPDVDKKADEFIAKFREQIRLQRIESIRRSTAQRAGKTLRNFNLSDFKAQDIIDSYLRTTSASRSSDMDERFPHKLKVMGIALILILF